MNIYRNGSLALVNSGVYTYSFDLAADERTPASGVQPFFSGYTTPYPYRIGQFQIVPYGLENNLPHELREMLDENGITPELLNKQLNLLWGQGPALYELKFEEGKRVKEWKTDTEIETWLKSWDWEKYLEKSSVEFRHVNGHFTKYFRNRAARISDKGSITHLEHVSSARARLEWPDEKYTVNNIIVGDYMKPWQMGLTKYPIFNPRDPFKYPVSMFYSNLYSFALDYDYSRPSYYGLINWIKLASSLPKLLMNFNANSAAIRYHIQSPAIYWSVKEDQLKKNCEMKGIEYKSEMLEDLKDDIIRKVVEGLVGIEKAGKMLTTETVWDDMGQQYVGWKIDTIDQKVKDYVDAQLEIAKRSDFEVTAGIGLHPALSNMSADGNLPSGSEQLYAFKLYLSTGVDIPEMIVCRDINYAIAANFPGKNIRVGFYHDTVTTEEATTPSNRIKNQK